MTLKMDKAMLLGTQEPTRYEDIKEFNQRCDDHPAHQEGMVRDGMLIDRLMEEIDELRAYIEDMKRHTDPGCWERGCCAVDDFKEKT